MAATAKLREIETLSVLSSDVRRFGYNCRGHLHIALSRSADLVNNGQSIYDKIEAKRKQIQEKLEHAQQKYESCMCRHKNDKDDRDPCSTERSKMEHYSALLQEISSVCQRAQGCLNDMKREREGMENICNKALADIESGVSSAVSALSNVRGSAEEYAHVKVPISNLTIPTNSYNGVTDIGSGNKTTDSRDVSCKNSENTEPNFAIPEELSGNYSISDIGTSSWLKDGNGQKIVRIKKHENVALLSGFNVLGGNIAHFSAVEAILQHNQIASASCWITADELDLYHQVGFAVKEKNEGGFIVARQYEY
jgi:hypothetical protein